MGRHVVLDNVQYKILNYSGFGIINYFFTDVYIGYISNHQNIQMENIMDFSVIHSSNVYNVFSVYILFISAITSVILIHIK